MTNNDADDDNDDDGKYSFRNMRADAVENALKGVGSCMANNVCEEIPFPRVDDTLGTKCVCSINCMYDLCRRRNYGRHYGSKPNLETSCNLLKCVRRHVRPCLDLDTISISMLRLRNVPHVHANTAFTYGWIQRSGWTILGDGDDFATSTMLSIALLTRRRLRCRRRLASLVLAPESILCFLLCTLVSDSSFMLIDVNVLNAWISWCNTMPAATMCAVGLRLCSAC